MAFPTTGANPSTRRDTFTRPATTCSFSISAATASPTGGGARWAIESPRTHVRPWPKRTRWTQDRWRCSATHWAVSYTHLRAHETRHDLVCRLLLEKKKKKK